MTCILVAIAIGIHGRISGVDVSAQPLPAAVRSAEGNTRTEISLNALVEVENNVESSGSYVDPAWRPKIKNRSYVGVQAQSRSDLTVHIKLGSQEVKYLRILDSVKAGPVVKTLELLPSNILDELERLRKGSPPQPAP